MTTRSARRARRTAVLLAAVLAATLGLAAPTGAAPGQPRFGPAIDGYAPYQAQSGCRSQARPGVQELSRLIQDAYPYDRILTIRACGQGGRSEHKDGRALDWMVNAYDGAQRAAADDFLHWLLKTDEHGNRHANFRRLGVMYVIWNRQWFSAWDQRWRPYSGYSPHTDHIHISFGVAGADARTSWFTSRLPVQRPQTTPPPPPPPVYPPLEEQEASLRPVPDVALAGGAGSFDLAYLGESREARVVRWSEGAGYTGAVDEGGRWAHPPAIARRADGRLLGVAVDAAGGVHVAESGPDGRELGRWRALDGVVAGGRAAVTGVGQEVMVAVRAQDGALHSLRSPDVGVFDAWTRLGGFVREGTRPAVASRDGAVETVVVGRERHLWRRTLDLGSGAWTRYEYLGGTAVGDVATSDDLPGTVTVAVRGRDAALYVRDLTATDDGSYRRLGGTLHSSPAADGRPGAAVVVVRGADGDLYRRVRAGGTWRSWDKL